MEYSIDYLTQSSERIKVLNLVQSDPIRPSDIGDRVNVTRRSIQRYLSEFEESGLIRNSKEGYEITPLGIAVLDEAVLSKKEKVG